MASNATSSIHASINNYAPLDITSQNTNGSPQNNGEWSSNTDNAGPWSPGWQDPISPQAPPNISQASKPSEGWEEDF